MPNIFASLKKGAGDFLSDIASDIQDAIANNIDERIASGAETALNEASKNPVVREYAFNYATQKLVPIVIIGVLLILFLKS